MNQVAYIVKFLFRIKWWLIICPIIVALMVYTKMGRQSRTFQSSTTIYTGIVSGYDIETGEGPRQDWNVINNAMDNLINIILSQSTLKNVSLRLYAQNLVHGDSVQDNQYITARSYRNLLRHTPKNVMALVDRTSEEKTLENLRNFETADHSNHIYGLFEWTHPHYSYTALSKIKVKRVGSSDMLEVSYSNDDPGIVYNTLVLLNDEFVKQYRDLRFGETNNVIGYFQSELDRVYRILSNQEDSLRDYNIANRVINYDKQTEHIAALSRDYELRYEDILLNYESAQKLRTTTENQLKDLQTFRNNAAFVQKLTNIGDLYAKISAAEAFTDNDQGLSSRRDSSDLNRMRSSLDRETQALQEITSDINSQRFTKEGISTESIINQWLAAVLLLEKSKAELAVMEERKLLLDNQYTVFSPIGSTLKRKNREINFSEQSYLSLLHALNSARLRQKNLQMSSATLKIINPPTLPIGAEPTKRKLMVAAAFFGTMIFVLALFVLLEMLDRTLRDKIRTERITGGKVLGAFPGSGRFGQRRYTEAYRKIAAGYLENAVLNYFRPGQLNIVNLLSTMPQEGKSLLLEQLAEILRESGLKVRTAEWDKDFDISQKGYLLATSACDFVTDKAGETPLAEADVLLVEYPAFEKCSAPRQLLRDASINLVVVSANRSWKDSDQLLFDKAVEQADGTPLFLYLNRASRDVVETFTGMLPPYSHLRKFMYQLSQFGFTSVR